MSKAIILFKYVGTIHYSQASIEKGKKLLNYNPKYSATEGFERACQWYFENL